MDAFLPRNKNLKPYSTKLRNEMTPQERKLWYEFLRTYPVRFNRQRIIGNYIADFYCDRAKLVVELDGEQHYLGDVPDYDAARTAYLEEQGILVLRVDNSELRTNFEGICITIDQIVQYRMNL